jgi:hypothetical protein
VAASLIDDFELYQRETRANYCVVGSCLLVLLQRLGVSRSADSMIADLSLIPGSFLEHPVTSLLSTAALINGHGQINISLRATTAGKNAEHRRDDKMIFCLVWMYFPSESNTAMDVTNLVSSNLAASNPAHRTKCPTSSPVLC